MSSGSARALPVLAFLAAPGILSAQGVQLGPEFRVNSYTTLQQLNPAVAFDSAGNFVVTWTDYSGHDGSGAGIFAQRYASAGAPLGAEFQVNTYVANNQAFPDIASDASGTFVVVWYSYGQDGSSTGVFGRRFSGTGAPLGGEFRVNSYTTNGQNTVSVASDSAGNFVVVWQGYGPGGGGIFGRRFAFTGIPFGEEFPITTSTATGWASVASDAAGNFIVAWTAADEDRGGVFARRYASSGSPIGGPFRVNTYTTWLQIRPAVASDSLGNFVVSWSSYNQDGPGSGIYAQRYSSTGVPSGGEFRVNTFTPGYQREPSVAADAAGNFVIAWMSYGQDGSGYGVFAQRYSSTGAPLGGEFRVNSFIPNTQYFPSVGADPAGDFVVVWTSYGQDGSIQGVFGQRYSPILPVELESFTVN